MKRFVMIIVMLMGWDAQARAQSFQPLVLVGADCGGRGPGQFDFEMESVPLEGLAIDENEHIFIIDEFNNRVQQYDEKGGYIGAIAFPPAVPPTEAEMQRNPDIPERPTFVEKILFVNGTLYARQQRCINGYSDYSCRVGYLLRAQGNSFVNADQDKDAKRILLMFTAKYVAAKFKRDLLVAYARLGVKPEDAYKRFPLGAECGVSRNCVIAQVFADSKGNAWVLSSEGLLVFGRTGSLLYKNNDVAHNAVLSTQGNLYLIFYADTRKDCVRVEKYSLFGK